MQQVRGTRFLLILTGVCAVVLFSLSPAQAAFFQIAEVCPSGLGNAFAGAAAAAENACTVQYNPAGMTLLKGSEFLIGLHGIKPSIKYTNENARTFFGQPITGGDGGDAGEFALVPNLYFTQKIGDRMAWGIGITAPFGLETQYEDDWIGRYHGVRSDIVTININPSFAYQLTKSFSFGIGINYQTLDATLTQQVDAGSACLAAEAAGAPAGTCAAFGLAPQSNDILAEVEADDTAWGYNAGLLWSANEFFRIGLHYRSKMDYDLEGTNTFTYPDPGTALFANLPNVNLVDSGATAGVELPDAISGSFWWMASKKWAVMGDVSRAGWSSVPELRIMFDNGNDDSVVTLDLEDSWRYSLGTTWYASEKWALRLGLALDETPVPNAEVRTPRLPDEDRNWYTIGFDYNFSPKMGINLSYALIDIDQARVEKRLGFPPDPTNEDFLRGSFVGDYDFSINILSAQFSWKFGGGS